ncbi:hypothetical protein D9M73_51590 [compost metagenome]
MFKLAAPTYKGLQQVIHPLTIRGLCFMFLGVMQLFALLFFMQKFSSEQMNFNNLLLARTNANAAELAYKAVSQGPEILLESYGVRTADEMRTKKDEIVKKASEIEKAFFASKLDFTTSLLLGIVIIANGAIVWLGMVGERRKVKASAMPPAQA